MHISENLLDKLLDGLLAGLSLAVLWLIIVLLVAPIQLFGTPGLLIYTLVLISLAFFSLGMALNNGLQEMTRITYGSAGGIILWTAVKVGILFGLPAINQENGLILWIIAMLFCTILWRKVIPLGVKFWLQAILMSWGSDVFLAGQKYLATLNPVIAISHQITGYLALFFLAGIIIYIFLRNETRTQRRWTALWMWFLIVLVAHIFWGPPI